MFGQRIEDLVRWVFKHKHARGKLLVFMGTGGHKIPREIDNFLKRVECTRPLSGSNYP